MNDTATSLQNLNDIVMPTPVSWWPLAPGWYVVAALIMAVLLVLGMRRWKRWRQNRYRGQALRELARMRQGMERDDLQGLPELLKRAALSAWPRNTVAALVGPDWHRFLDDSAGIDRFCSGMGQVLDRLAHAPARTAPISRGEATAVLDAAEVWLKQHSAPGEGG